MNSALLGHIRQERIKSQETCGAGKEGQKRGRQQVIVGDRNTHCLTVNLHNICDVWGQARKAEPTCMLQCDQSMKRYGLDYYHTAQRDNLHHDDSPNLHTWNHQVAFDHLSSYLIRHSRSEIRNRG